jgi:hypothetical protein
VRGASCFKSKVVNTFLTECLIQLCRPRVPCDLRQQLHGLTICSREFLGDLRSHGQWLVTAYTFVGASGQSAVNMWLSKLIQCCLSLRLFHRTWSGHLSIRWIVERHLQQCPLPHARPTDTVHAALRLHLTKPPYQRQPSSTSSRRWGLCLATRVNQVFCLTRSRFSPWVGQPTYSTLGHAPIPQSLPAPSLRGGPSRTWRVGYAPRRSPTRVWRRPRQWQLTSWLVCARRSKCR